MRLVVLVLLLVIALGWLALKYAGRGRPPAVGEAAPEFSLPDAAHHVHHLADYRGRWLVLYFYPKAGTPGCTQEACSLRDAWGGFLARGVAVLGVSMDDTAGQAAFAREHRLPFPLLTDATGSVARAYGALWDFGVLRFPKRYTFLIDPQGRVAKAYLDVSPARHAREILDDLAGFGL